MSLAQHFSAGFQSANKHEPVKRATETIGIPIFSRPLHGLDLISTVDPRTKVLGLNSVVRYADLKRITPPVISIPRS